MYFVSWSCHFETLLHAKWSNYDNTQGDSTKFAGMFWEGKKIIPAKNFKQRPSKLKKATAAGSAETYRKVISTNTKH